MEVLFVKLDDLHKLMEVASPPLSRDSSLIRKKMQELGLDPDNYYQELEMSSRYVNTHRDTSHAGTTVALHSHGYSEILYCRTSANVEYLIGSKRYRVQKGDVILVPAGISHRPIFPEQMPVPYERDVLWVSQEFIELLTAYFSGPSSKVWNHLIRTADTRWEFLGELFQKGVQEELRKRPGWEAIVMGNTMMILSYLDRASTEHTAGVLTAEKPELSDKVTAYIEAHFTEHITVSHLAHKFFVSESSISHQFKQKMGISIYHYVTQRRLIGAKNLIQQGVPLEHIAPRVGFSDYSSFYRAFKQEYGISPRQYRQKIL